MILSATTAGGGYLFNTGGSMDNVKYENVTARFETTRSYGENKTV